VGLKQISFNIYYSVATRGRMSPIAISPYQLLSLWRHSSTALAAPVVIMTYISHLWRSQPPFSLWCHLLLSWPRPALRMNVRTDTLLHLIY